MSATRTVEHEVRADEVRPGDYLAGIGRVQSVSHGHGRVTLYSGGADFKVWLSARHRVVVVDTAQEPEVA